MNKVKKIVVGDKNHCLQSSFRMVVAALTGKDPGFEITEEITGYVEGRGTWQFRALLGFANIGLSVVDHENFNAAEFIRAPEESIRKQVNDDIVASQNIADTDLDAEVEALRACIESPRIKFVESIPTMDDMRNEIKAGRLLICNINVRIIQQKEGHLGHFVVVENISDDAVTYHDPFPPGELAAKSSYDLFLRAWMSPSANMANYISVGLK